MSKDYIETEVDKIIQDKTLDFPKNMAMACAWILGNFKGISLKVLDLRNATSLADYFVIASATNLTQARSMADAICKQMQKHEHETLSKEGIAGSDWILLDFGDIIVHIFQEISRDIYNLEDLWREATPIEIPQHYYFSEEAQSGEEKKENLDYF